MALAEATGAMVAGAIETEATVGAVRTGAAIAQVAHEAPVMETLLWEAATEGVVLCDFVEMMARNLATSAT